MKNNSEAVLNLKRFEFREAIARWERNKGTSTKLLNLEILIRCHHSLGSHPDTLLRDESGKLYLVYCTRSLPDDSGEEVPMVGIDGNWAPLNVIREGHIEPCSVLEALDWFATCYEFMDSWDGDAVDLCGVAAGEIERLRASELQAA